MAEFEILLLGPPEVRSQGRCITIEQRLPYAMLFYLASQGSLIGQDILLTMFWENEAEATASERLKETLSQLQSALPDKDMLVFEGDLVGLDFQRVYVDQLEFQELIDRAGRLPWQIPPEQPLPEQVSQNLSRAVQLWRGTNLLEGAELPAVPTLDEWLRHTNQQLSNLRIRVLERLVDHLCASGNLEAALDMVRVALASDPLNEDLHFRALTCLIGLGRKQEAQEHFQSFQRVLLQEYQLPPSPKLVALYRQIRPQVHHPIAPARAAWRTWSSLEIPFVGREAALTKMFTTLSRGGGLAVLGESGLGKTRLVQEFCQTLASDRRILLMHGRQAEGNLPFQPFIELFRNSLYPEEWLSLSQVWAGHLAVLLPELLVMRPDLELALAPSDHSRSSAFLYESIRQVLLLIAQESPLILFLDNAHWADEATLAAVAYLLERPPFDWQALLILAARQEEANPNLENLLSLAQPASMFRMIQLSRLSQEEVLQLGRSVLGPLPDPQFIQQLSQETGGNPLFVLETLRTIKEKSIRQSREPGARLPTAESIQVLIRSRLRRLTPEARAVIESAAIIGSEFNPEVISQVNKKSLAEVGGSLDELEKHILVEPLSAPPQPIRYGFIHDKFREIILEDLTPVRAAYLHRRVAHTLVANPGLESEKQAAVIAQHYEAGGEAAQAFRFWLEAGEHASRLYSVHDAMRIFKHAESLIETAGNQVSDEFIRRLYSQWTQVAFTVEDAESIEAQNSNLLQLGKRRNSPLLIGTALDGLGDACLARNQFEDGLALTNEALPYLEKSGNLPELMDAYNHRGVFLYFLSRLPESIESFQDTLALGAGNQEPLIVEARAGAHFQMSLVHTLGGWPEKAEDHALHSLKEGAILGQTSVQAYLTLSLARYFLGEFEQARQDNQTGLDLAHRTEEVRMSGYLHAVRAMIELGIGNLSLAMKNAEQAASLGEIHGHNDMIAFGYRVIGDIHALLESPQTAIEFFQKGIKVYDLGFWTIDIGSRLGFALARTGQVETGLKCLYQSIAAAQSGGIEMVVTLSQLFLGIVHAELNDWAEVRRLATELVYASTKRKLRWVRLITQMLLGSVAYHDGDLPLALEYHQAAAKEALELKAPLIEVRTLVPLIHTLRSARMPDEEPTHRLMAILDQLETTATEDSIRSLTSDFRRKIVAQI